MLNARIRKRWRAGRQFPIGVIGEAADLTYDYEYLGAAGTLAPGSRGNRGAKR